ncbi:TRAP transporter substrate-binding protein [Halomonas desiderata]|uniref:TRAP transporter substrate-binding protein n=1 Tax=Billgrantia aerodenitrificans TaxID=2733483 RepID=A0ABS9AWH6_9GAMM|nr:TRAP transporter substrate-binding protein [Halomonas aerodenitrificans]MCE8026261.1 TRAP transporter substrate-binding protein [Halomonas aerodenitrificans]NIC36223.1 TRAP transporter substrate-binding protein [Halomonas desiderata]
MNHAISRSLLAACAAGIAFSAQADTLRMSHFWPANSDVNKEIFEAWAKHVEEATGGELTIENYPSQTLSRSEQAYQGTVNGISDIAITMQGYTAGRFPLSEIVQLPGVSGSAPQGGCILQTLYDEGHIADEYDDVKVLYLFTTGPAYLHTRGHAIETPDDLRGLRIRRPSDVAGEILERLGANPVGMPAPDIYTSLQRGVMDGLSFPWQAMKTFGINELADHHLEVPYYTGVAVAVMNHASYERLSPEQQAAIDEVSGMAWTRRAGEVYARLDREGREEAEAQGGTINTVEDPLNDPEWSGPLNEGTEAYLVRLEQRGIDNAREVYQRALELRDECPVEPD